MHNTDQESDTPKSTPTLIDKPPFFNNWKQIYAFVLGSFSIIVILLYLFTITFS